MENKAKQKAEFDAYKSYCTQNNISPCRVESAEMYLTSKQNALSL